jgi:hypothetical protein
MISRICINQHKVWLYCIEYVHKSRLGVPSFIMKPHLIVIDIHNRYREAMPNHYLYTYSLSWNHD